MKFFSLPWRDRENTRLRKQQTQISRKIAAAIQIPQQCDPSAKPQDDIKKAGIIHACFPVLFYNYTFAAFLHSITACAAASLACGTLYGEQDT